MGSFGSFSFGSFSFGSFSFSFVSFTLGVLLVYFLGFFITVITGISLLESDSESSIIVALIQSDISNIVYFILILLYKIQFLNLLNKIKYCLY